MNTQVETFDEARLKALKGTPKFDNMERIKELCATGMTETAAFRQTMYEVREWGIANGLIAKPRAPRKK